MPEHDPFATRLAALAPTVDLTASRLMFERHRSHDVPTKRRWLLPAAVTTLLIAGVVGVCAIARPDQRSVAPVNSVDDGSGDGSDPEPSGEPDLIATDVVLPLPAVGEPRLHTGTFGVVWVVHHDDGTVSVLNAVRPRSEADDGVPVEGLGHLVQPTEGGRSFVGRDYLWDAHGRTLNGPRTADLVGFAGNVVDGEVELFVSTATRFDGEPDDPPVVLVDPPDLSGLTLLDLGQLATLSFSGPIWRLLDATLVVQDGVGTLCSIDSTAPVPDLSTCEDGRPTAVTSSNPDLTRWFFGPLLAEFDDFGRIVTVAPLGGETSRTRGAGGVTAGQGWRLLSDSWNTELTGLPHLAVDDSSLAELGNDAGPLDVDLDEQFVVAVSVFGNSCPPVVAGVDVEAGRVAVRFKRSPAVTCDDVGIVYGFVVAVDRVATGDVVQVSATDPAGLSAAHETTFDVRSGDLLEGGLAFQQFEPVFVDCSEVVGGLDLIVPIETVIEREVVVAVHDTDGAPLATRGIALTTGSNEVRVPVPGDLAGDLAIGVTAAVPAAQLERTVTLTSTDIADTTRGCG